jgi:hypothetical protein
MDIGYEFLNQTQLIPGMKLEVASTVPEGKIVLSNLSIVCVVSHLIATKPSLKGIANYECPAELRISQHQHNLCLCAPDSQAQVTH